MIVSVVTLGCKVNQCESADIISALNKLGHTASEGLAPADVYVINTCSVTAEADRKSRQYVGKAVKLNPNCGIIIIGCSSQHSKEKFKLPNVIAVGGTANKTEFIIESITLFTKKMQYSTISDRVLYDKKRENGAKIGKTRAFIKVQDGCNRFCTYCIIPYLRGRSKSRSIDDIVLECHEKSCSKEIVITGIDISMYGADIGCDLVDLVNALSSVDARKRLGSLECEAISDVLLKAMGESGFCPHFHLSLQSGDNDVLKSMNRRYTPEFFYEKVCLIRKFFPNAGITTDIIVGFPTETAKSFENTLDFARHCEFSDIHAFPYSAREGTLATKKYKVLPRAVINERKDRLLELKHDLRQVFFKKNIGEIAPVYTEDMEDGYTVGYTPNYIKVYSHEECGQIINLTLSEPFKDGMLAKS